MMRSHIPNLLRVLYLFLVIATGTSGIAFADHGGSHGEHCITVDEVSMPHQHLTADTDTEHPENAEEACVQHSCVAVFSSRMFTGDLLSSAVAQNTHGYDSLIPFLRVVNLYRPPIA